MFSTLKVLYRGGGFVSGLQRILIDLVRVMGGMLLRFVDHTATLESTLNKG